MIRLDSRQILWSILASPVVASGSLGGQSVVQGQRLVACDTCRVVAVPLLRIGGPADDGIDGLPAAVVRDSHGRIVILSRNSEVMPVVYDSTGAYLGALTRRGDGPGELQYPSWIVRGRDDTIRVFQFNRITMFGPDLKVARTVVIRDLIGGESSVSVLSPALYLSRSGRGATGADPSPNYLRDFSGRTVRLLPGIIGEWSTHGTAAASNSTFWRAKVRTHRSRGYRLELVDTAGNVRAAFDDQPPWWVGKDTTVRVLEGPAGTGAAVFPTVDSRGRVLLLIHSHVTDWNRVVADGNLDQAFRTLVTVVHPKSGNKADAQWIDEQPIGFVDDAHFATYREDDDGVPYITIWSLSISGL